MAPNLKNRARIAAAEAEFEYALRELRADGVRLNCDDRPEVFSDYEHNGGRPSPEEARALCGDCPFFAECKTFSDITKPGHGIWAGVVWRYGRPIRREPVKALEEIAD